MLAAGSRVRRVSDVKVELSVHPPPQRLPGALQLIQLRPGVRQLLPRRLLRLLLRHLPLPPGSEGRRIDQPCAPHPAGGQPPPASETAHVLRRATQPCGRIADAYLHPGRRHLRDAADGTGPLLRLGGRCVQTAPAPPATAPRRPHAPDRTGCAAGTAAPRPPAPAAPPPTRPHGSGAAPGRSGSVIRACRNGHRKGHRHQHHPRLRQINRRPEEPAHAHRLEPVQRRHPRRARRGRPHHTAITVRPLAAKNPGVLRPLLLPRLLPHRPSHPTGQRGDLLMPPVITRLQLHREPPRCLRLDRSDLGTRV